MTRSDLERQHKTLRSDGVIFCRKPCHNKAFRCFHLCRERRHPSVTQAKYKCKQMEPAAFLGSPMGLSLWCKISPAEEKTINHGPWCGIIPSEEMVNCIHSITRGPAMENRPGSSQLPQSKSQTIYCPEKKPHPLSDAVPLLRPFPALRSSVSVTVWRSAFLHQNSPLK